LSASHLVTRIVRDSILDGPGCRYVLYVKGCNLRCRWCHNPETQRAGQEVIVFEQFCIHCGVCTEAAPPGADRSITPVPIPDPSDPAYFPCVDACPSGALDFVGKSYSTDWIAADLMKYARMYQDTGGGLTISGGEPLTTPAFCQELLERVQARNIHTAVDTALAVPWSILEPLLPCVGLWLCDLKHPSDPEMKAPLVIDNLRKLARVGAKIWIRIPTIPGYNDEKDTWLSFAEIVAELGDAVSQVALLPYHPYGREKYVALGKKAVVPDEAALTDEAIVDMQAVFSARLPHTAFLVGRTLAQG